MAQLPYVTLQQSQAPGIIGDIGDSLVQAAQRSMQQKQQAIDNLLKQKQMEAQEAQMRAQEARAQAEAARQEHYAIREQHRYEHQQKQEAAGALKPMNEMFASGDTAGAMALGKIHGFDLSQKNILEDPGAAPQAPQQAPAGPIPTPADRDHGASQPGSPIGPDPSGAEQMALSDQQQAGDQQMASQQEQYAQALANHPQLVAEHAKRLADYKQAKENPVYSGTGPFGAVEFNPGAVRAQKEARAAQEAEVLSQGLPPKYQAMMAAKIKGNVPQAVASQQIDSLMRADEDRAVRQQNADQQLTRDQRLAAAMAMGGSRERVATHADDRQGRTQFHQDITTDAKTIEKEFRAPYVESKKAVQLMDADPQNPETWIGGRDLFVRAFSGGKVTKAQYDQAATHGAPKFDKLNQILEGWTTGLPSETQRKNLRAALQSLSDVNARNLREKAGEFESNYGQDPLVAKGDKVAAGTYKRTTGRLFNDVPKEEAKPTGGGDRVALAREALADPSAPEAVKAQARKILAGN